MKLKKIVTSITLCALVMLTASANNNGLKLALAKAKEKQTPVFIIVTSNNIDKKYTKQAFSITNSAQKHIKVANVFELNIDDKANDEFVDNWKLESAPLPLIVVLSPQGNFIGGISASKASADDLLSLIPSPKLDDIYSASTNKKALFIVMGSKNDVEKPKVIANCNAAIEKLKGKAVLVNIDFEDKAEIKLLAYMKVNPEKDKLITMVLNKYGETTGVFKNEVLTDKLTEAATKETEENCCHGSCGHSH